MPMRFLYILGIIAVFAFFISRKNRKLRACSWAGTVTDIRHQRTSVKCDEERKDEDWVTICYRTEAGNEDKIKIRMRVMRQFFSGLKPGDRLVKRVGEYLPRQEETPHDHPAQVA